MMAERYRIKNNIYISDDELTFKASRSSGPGGQSVNKLNTKITLYFNLPQSDAFTPRQKKRILKKLNTRSNKEGVIRVVSQKHRSQKANRNAAVQKLIDLLQKALKRKKRRKKTTPSYAARMKSKEKQKKHSQKKKQRKMKKFDLSDYEE